jgi:lysophospholipase L1-like esterase
LNTKRPGPCLALNAAAGPDGEPWVYWSAFDGHDYEIEGARRRAGFWSAAPALTDNGLDDILEGLGYESGRFTASWKRPALSPRAVLKRSWAGIDWSPEAGASDGAPRKGPERPALAKLKLTEPDRPFAEPGEGLDDNTTICLGDSITYGVINDEYHPELGYVPRLQALMTAAFGAANLVNAGSPGEVTFNGLGRLDGLIEEHRGRYVLIMEGTNDVVFNEIAMEASAFHVEQMIRKCVRARVFPLLATILPRTDGRWDRKFYRDRILALNTSLRNIAQNLHIPLVDQFTVFYDYPEAEGGFRALFSDGNHPNETGYDLMSRAWFDEVRRIPFCPVVLTARRVVERSLLASRTLDVVSWPHNPKLLDPTPHLAYRIYRRDAALPGGWERIASLPFSIYHSPQTFFDFAVLPDRRYLYTVALVRTDGVEGPLSDPAED